MKQCKLNSCQYWGIAARYGAAAGFISALFYGAVATLYITLRSSAQILGVLSPAEGLWRTLAANAFGIIWPCLVTTLLLGVLAAIIETVAFFIIHGLSLILKGQRSPTQVAVIGFAVSASLAFLVNFLVVGSISTYWSAFWPIGYLFWLGLPSLIFIGTTTWLCWQEGVNPVSQRPKLTQAMVG